ncbi:MAG TPA: SDR family oxidoreductase [Acidimicrobiales bacterium]|nr:SDR family oxidoreductase [Acidimicrobiales bacterium]
MSRMLDGTVSVVAGGSSGIGLAVVTRLAEHGAVVEFLANDPDGVASAERDFRDGGADVRGSVVDASDPAQVHAFMEGVAERHGRLGVLVNCIGIQRYGTVESTSPETWDEVFAVNLKSMFLTAKYAVPLMRRNGGGAIVNVSSAQAVASQQNVVAYTATKGAIVAMTRAMAVDHAREGIRVNSVCPGSVDTPMLWEGARNVSEEDPGKVVAGWGSMYPLGRIARPAEIADAIVYLASPYSSFVTGADLRVDGGLLAGVALPAPEARLGEVPGAAHGS